MVTIHIAGTYRVLTDDPYHMVKIKHMILTLCKRALVREKVREHRLVCVVRKVALPLKKKICCEGQSC